jgi:hypothetical protein
MKSIFSVMAEKEVRHYDNDACTLNKLAKIHVRFKKIVCAKPMSSQLVIGFVSPITLKYM